MEKLAVVLLIGIVAVIVTGCATTGIQYDQKGQRSVTMDSTTFLGMGTDYADRILQQQQAVK